MGLIVVSGILLLYSMWGPTDEQGRRGGWMDNPLAQRCRFLGSPILIDPEFSVWRDIARGQVWRLVTPILLHANILHLAMNAYLLGIVGSQIERSQGTLWFVLVVLAIAIPSNVAQAMIDGPFFGGLSGVVYGVVGYVYWMHRRRPELRMSIARGQMQFWLAFMLLGFTGWIGPIANWAHAVGFLAGLAVAAAVAPWKSLPHNKT